MNSMRWCLKLLTLKKCVEIAKNSCGSEDQKTQRNLGNEHDGNAKLLQLHRKNVRIPS